MKEVLAEVCDCVSQRAETARARTGRRPLGGRANSGDTGLASTRLSYNSTLKLLFLPCGTPWVAASHAFPVGDLAHNPGMCPDWEPNHDLLVPRLVLNPLSHSSQGYSSFFKRINAPEVKFE